MTASKRSHVSLEARNNAHTVRCHRGTLPPVSATCLCARNESTGGDGGEDKALFRLITATLIPEFRMTADIKKYKEINVFINTTFLE
jgi:hypothetical protein